MEKKNQLKSCCKKMLSSPNVSIGDLQRTRRFVMKQQTTCVEDSRLRPSGMTGLFYHGNNAFTLIELLVVVLIIGILAAVALPQYQLAVEKSRATEAFVNLRAVHNEVELYYLANGEYPASLAEIDMETPDNHYFDYNYVRDIAVRLHSPLNASTGRQYAIFRLLDHRTWSPQYPNAGCNVFLPDDGTSSFAVQLCKNLCKTSTLTTVWGGGEKGCRFNM